MNAYKPKKGKGGKSKKKEAEAYEPEPTRSSACEACSSFSGAFASAKYVGANSALCLHCWSMISSCDEKKFTWRCYDEHEQFHVMEKQGNNPSYDEAREMHEFFKNKEPEKCKAPKTTRPGLVIG